MINTIVRFISIRTLSNLFPSMVVQKQIPYLSVIDCLEENRLLGS